MLPCMRSHCRHTMLSQHDCVWSADPAAQPHRTTITRSRGHSKLQAPTQHNVICAVSGRRFTLHFQKGNSQQIIRCLSMLLR